MELASEKQIVSYRRTEKVALIVAVLRDLEKGS